MPEDQSVNGDIWNEEAGYLFQKLGWQKIADSNIDIPGADGMMHGIDSIYSYKDGFNPIKSQAVFIEAKRYATTSFSPTKLSDWIGRMDAKIRELKFGTELYDRYPLIQELKIGSSVLAIWFHDYENYPSIRSKFQDALKAVKTPRTRGPNTVNRLFVIENDNILRLASLVDAVEKWNNEFKLSESPALEFYYPSSTLSGYAGQANQVVNLEYIFSRFVFCKIEDYNR